MKCFYWFICFIHFNPPEIYFKYYNVAIQLYFSQDGLPVFFMAVTLIELILSTKNWIITDIIH